MATFYKAPTSDFKSTTLNGSINDSVDTITLASATGFQYPGVVIIDREDGNGTATPSSREVVAYTGISGNDLTGCTRAFANSTARSHSSGALVEAVFNVTTWNDLRDAVTAGLNTDGLGLHVSNATITAVTQSARLAISSIASVARLEGIGMAFSSIASIARLDSIRLAVSSVATIPSVQIATHLNASGASLTGFSSLGGFNALFQVPGSLASQANIGGMVVVPQAQTATHMVAYVQTPCSIASIAGYILRQGGEVVGMFTILGGTTYGSSASLAVAALAAGDNLTLDIRSTASLATDLSAVLRAS